jgi:hypothetical protein
MQSPRRSLTPVSVALLVEDDTDVPSGSGGSFGRRPRGRRGRTGEEGLGDGGSHVEAPPSMSS